MSEIELISVVPATADCTAGRHTFLTTLIPPRAEQRCECGAQTWRDACDVRYIRAVELAADERDARDRADADTRANAFDESNQIQAIE